MVEKYGRNDSPNRVELNDSRAKRPRAKRLTGETTHGRNNSRAKDPGPPWGTPDVTGTSDELSPSSTTAWVRPTRKALIQFRVFPFTPCWDNLNKSLEWLTLSNALLKSSKIRSTCSCSTSFLPRSSTSWISCVSHDLLSLKPCWRS